MTEQRPGRRLDSILVIDIEATCWNGPVPEGQENEIIEIGLCVFEVATRKRLEKRSMLVKPEHAEVSEFCTHLTTITPEMVEEQGMPFVDACALLQQSYAAKDCVWASYGDYDRTLFERQCRARGVEYPFGPRHLNIKTLFALTRGLPREIGMITAMNIAQLELEGTHHRGDDDAWNTAALLAETLARSQK